jgi:hypothetical protein
MGDTYNVLQNFAGFTIDRDGVIQFPVGGQPQRKDYILRADPRLQDPNKQWVFAHNYDDYDIMDNQYQHQLRAILKEGYQVGQYGKGIIDADGNLHSWSVGDYHDNLPSHHDVEQHLGTRALVYFGMDPNGQPNMMNAGYDRVTNRELPFQTLAPHYTTAHKFLEQFKPAEGEWDFARVSADRQRWLDAWDETIDQPHRFKETEMVPIEALKPFKEWSRDIDRSEYTRDLRNHIQQHGVTGTTFLDYDPDTGHGHMSEGNHRLEIADQLGITHLPVTVYRSGRKPREGQWEGHPFPQTIEPDKFGYVPQYIRPSEVGLPGQPIELGRSSHIGAYDSGAFATELALFLDQVGREQAHKEGPTPHHDSEDDFKQPTILSRIRNKFVARSDPFQCDDPDCPLEHIEPDGDAAPCIECGQLAIHIPCDHCGGNPNGEVRPTFEQQERDWYDSEPKGAPTKWPYQAEPWRTEHHAPTIGLASRQAGSQSLRTTSLHNEGSTNPSLAVHSGYHPPIAQDSRDDYRREFRSYGERTLPSEEGDPTRLPSLNDVREPTFDVREDVALDGSRRSHLYRSGALDQGNDPSEAWDFDSDVYEHRRGDAKPSTKVAAIDHERIQWYGRPPHRNEGDHSFFYDRAQDVLHIGTPELHHEDLSQASGIDLFSPEGERDYPQGSISDTNVNMDVGNREDRDRIRQILGLGQPTDDWRFG